MRVPFVFPTLEWEVLREEVPGSGTWRIIREGDAGGLRDIERVAVERRTVFAMLHPEFPACQIDKIVPPAGRQVRFSEDHVLTLFHCVQRRDIPGIWDELLSHPERHKRFGYLGEIELPNGKTTELAVSFRRSQQIFGKHLAPSVRIASPIERLEGVGDGLTGRDGLDVVLGYYATYMTQV